MYPVDSQFAAEHSSGALAARPQNGGGPADREWTLIDCCRVLYRRRKLLLSVIAAGVGVAVLVSAMQTPMYQSRASVQIQGLNENFLSLRDIYPTAAPGADNVVYIQTQAEILRQDALLEQVVRKLRLEGSAYAGAPRHMSRLGGPSTALDELRKHVQILPSRGSSIIQILCEADDPKLAADIADSLAESFIEQAVDARQHAAKQTQAALSQEREALVKKLQQSEVEFDIYARRERGSTVQNALKREIESNRRFYQSISQRIDEARVASFMNQSNVRLVSPARPATRPYKPNFVLNVGIGFIGALIIGIGFVMLREQTRSALRTPSEASAYLALPELGAIPRAETGRPARFGSRQRFHTSSVERVPPEPSSSGMSESFRAAAASILATGSEEDHPHVLVVTSSRPGEGKTTVVSNLAIALAEVGGKVLLIDGDLRRPRLHKIFRQANSWGLSDLLREKNAIEEIPLETLVKQTAVPRLYLLSGGTSVENICALLWSAPMARLLSRCRDAFDYVLIDAPPCLEFADARILGRYAEKLILVVRADFTGRETAQAGVQRLTLDGIPIMGLIFNCWDSSSRDIYGYRLYRQEVA
jgi:succinoglycan biosynthesis transport protein ExoP